MTHTDTITFSSDRYILSKTVVFQAGIEEKIYTYTAREWDTESSTYYYRARNQDPRIGRFLSADPIGYDGGINLYTYVFNSPVILLDRWGFAPTNPEEIKRIQKIVGTNPDGNYGPKTNEAVKRYQEQLKKLGYYKGKIDGDWGHLTEEAHEKFEKDSQADPCEGKEEKCATKCKGKKNDDTITCGKKYNECQKKAKLAKNLRLIKVATWATFLLTEIADVEEQVAESQYSIDLRKCMSTLDLDKANIESGYRKCCEDCPPLKKKKPKHCKMGE